MKIRNYIINCYIKNFKSLIGQLPDKRDTGGIQNKNIEQVLPSF